MLYMTSRTSGLAAGLYFISLVILGSYYVLNLFLAVMWHVNNKPQPAKPPRTRKKRKKVNTELGAEDDDNEDDDEEEEEQEEPGPPTCLQRVVHSAAFQSASVGLIVVNVFILMCEHCPPRAFLPPASLPASLQPLPSTLPPAVSPPSLHEPPSLTPLDPPPSLPGARVRDGRDHRRAPRPLVPHRRPAARRRAGPRPAACLEARDCASSK